MRSVRFRIIASISSICMLLFSGCNYPLVKTVEVTRVQTVVVTELLVVTATPQETPNLPNASGTPNPFIVWSSEQVAEAFSKAGLEVDHPRPMTFDDYGLVPMLAIDGTRFFIPSICADCGGRIMSFANKEELTIVQNYYAQMTRFGAVLFSWVFIKDNILVQLNGELPEADARKYEALLESLK